jgi:hypothetical protein
MAGGADMAGAQASGGALNAVGYGLSNLLNPQDDLESLMKKFNFGGGGGFSLNNGRAF